MSDELAAWLRGEVERVKRNAERALADPYTTEGGGIRIVGGQLAMLPATASDRMALHLVSNGPLDVIARCEAELAILDEHARHRGACRTCWIITGNSSIRATAPCRTVRLLGSGYRHRPGYQEGWAP